VQKSSALDVIGIGGREGLIVPSGAVPVRVHHGNRAHMRPALLGRRENRAHLHHRSGIAVIRPLGRDDALPAARVARDAKRQLVRLTPGAAERGHGKPAVEEGGEALGVSHDVLIEIAGVDVEDRGLAGERRDDARMAMADVRHIIIGVEIAFTLGVIQPDAFAPDQMQRPFVKERRVAAQNAIASFQERVDSHTAASSIIVLGKTRRAPPGSPATWIPRRRRWSGR
jgi:hypothetical protein